MIDEEIARPNKVSEGERVREVCRGRGRERENIFNNEREREK